MQSNGSAIDENISDPAGQSAAASADSEYHSKQGIVQNDGEAR